MWSRTPKAWIACVVVLVSSSACDATDGLLERFEPRGTYEAGWESLPEVSGVSDIRLGAFTGLSYVSGREFYTVTDRGPLLGSDVRSDSARYFLAPDFAPEIIRLALQDDGSIAIEERLPISAPTGNQVSGLPPPAPWNANEALLNDPPAGSDEWGLHPGGVVMNRETNFFWISDHYGPGLFQVTVDGEIVRRLRALEGLRRAYLTRQRSSGFSGIDIEPSGRVVATIERPLENRIAPDDAINDSLRRIVRFDPDTGEERSLFYMVEPESVDGVPAGEVRIGHIAAIRDNEYLIAEHGEVGGHGRSLLFAVSVADSSTQARPGLEGIVGKTIETLTEQEWRDAGFIPVNKVLVADLSAEGVNRPDGLAVVDDRHVAVLVGNDYGIVSSDAASRSYSVEPKGIRVVIVELEEGLSR